MNIEQQKMNFIGHLFRIMNDLNNSKGYFGLFLIIDDLESQTKQFLKEAKKERSSHTPEENESEPIQDVHSEMKSPKQRGTGL